MRRFLVGVIVAVFLVCLPTVGSADPIIWTYRGSVGASTVPEIPPGSSATFVLTLGRMVYADISHCALCTLPPESYVSYWFGLEATLGDIAIRGPVMLEFNYDFDRGLSSATQWVFAGGLGASLPPPAILFMMVGPPLRVDAIMPSFDPSAITAPNRFDLLPLSAGWAWRESPTGGGPLYSLPATGTLVPVPEPGSLLLLGTGLVGLRVCRKRRR